MARRTPFTLATRAIPQLVVRPENTMLLVQDMQGYFVDSSLGYGKVATERGIAREFASYYEQLSVIRVNVSRLLQAFRRHEMSVVYTRWAYAENRDISLLQRSIGATIHEESVEARIDSALRPRASEPVFSKTGFGAFSSTAFIDELQHRRVENLVLTGVMSEFGIRSTALAAVDHGFRVIVVSDGCAGVTLDTHRAAVSELSFGPMKVRSTGEMLRYFEGLEREDLILV